MEYPNQDALIEGGYVRQESRTQGGWLVYYSHPATWDTTQVVFFADDDDEEEK